jgi:hypothetical protein
MASATGDAVLEGNPLDDLGQGCAPSSFRHFACADIISLNAMARQVLRLRQPFVLPVW